MQSYSLSIFLHNYAPSSLPLLSLTLIPSSSFPQQGGSRFWAPRFLLPPAERNNLLHEPLWGKGS